MADSPVDFRPDGSITFQVDDDKIIWRPPRMRHLQAARDRHSEMARHLQTVLEDLKDAITDDTADDDAAAVQLQAESLDMMEQWVRQLHADLALPSSAALPDSIDDWPIWLPRLSFATAVTKHWGSNPFS